LPRPCAPVGDLIEVELVKEAQQRVVGARSSPTEMLMSPRFKRVKPGLGCLLSIGKLLASCSALFEHT
jgi:hypothetical protein